MDIFVAKNAEVKVSVFVWTDNGVISASNLKEDVPKNTESKTIEFVFKRTNYKDSSRIMKRAKLSNVGLSEQGGGGVSADLVGMQDEMLRSQLIKIIDGDKEVFANNATVDTLEPAVARAAIAAVFDKVGV